MKDSDQEAESTVIEQLARRNRLSIDKTLTRIIQRRSPSNKTRNQAGLYSKSYDHSTVCFSQWMFIVLGAMHATWCHGADQCNIVGLFPGTSLNDIPVAESKEFL